MRKVGADINSSDRWEYLSDSYAHSINSEYHQSRLAALYHVIPDTEGVTALDFGCGEGVICSYLKNNKAANVVGIDPNENLISKAKEQFPKIAFEIGGVERLKYFEDDYFDLFVAANVIAYLTDEEEDVFYREAGRILKKGGHLIVSHSNDLFDLFTLNKYTVEFFEKYFGCTPTNLLQNSSLPARNSFNKRENPLNYYWKVKELGFELEQSEYANYHSLPPLLSDELPDDMSRIRQNSICIPESEKWKYMFQCSMFIARLKNKKKL